MKALKLVILFILIENSIIAQKPFVFTAETGIVQPIPIFHMGLDVSSNKDRKLTANVGLSALMNFTWNYDRKSSISMGVYYESYSLNLKEYGTFPSDIFTGLKSFFYSNFDVKNLGIRTSFGNILSEKIKLNAGFQLGFPLNHHFGYIYVRSLDLIEKRYDYETRNPFSLLANIEYKWYKTKRLEFIVVPELVYNLQKDAKTYILENQIRKMCFALRLGIRFKK